MHHVRETHGIVEVQLHAFLPSTQDGTSGQVHVPAGCIRVVEVNIDTFLYQNSMEMSGKLNAMAAFTPGERSKKIYWTRSCVGVRREFS